ncbi:hypothetical protein STENM223S_04072 [Streptomyces tendae]
MVLAVAGDLLSRLGVDHLYAGQPERYPRVPLDELRRTSVPPDEPAPVHRRRLPDAFPGTALAPVGGRHLTWYGPSLARRRRRGPHWQRRAADSTGRHKLA